MVIVADAALPRLSLTVYVTGKDPTQESQIKVLTFAAWIIGAAVGFMTVKGLFTLTTIPSVDSILVACIAYAILSRASQHR